MQERHKNRKVYFTEQGLTTSKYVIPYIEQVHSVEAGMRVLEIGCGEGGNLTPFIDRGCEVMGIDLDSKKLANAKLYLEETYKGQSIELLDQNIYEVSGDDIGRFDIIMLRDVIEHIPEQKKFMHHLKSFMKEDGVVFFGFPPWRMPFGGHQQTCHNKLLSKLPYFHLLPMFMFKGVLKLFGEHKSTIRSLEEIKDTGIGINKFLRVVKENDLHFAEKDLFLINPNYEVKFGLKPRKQVVIMKDLPYLRDFFTTCVYCVVRK